MANIFRNIGASINVTPGTVIYTVPSGRVAIAHSLYVSNNTNVPQNATIEVIDTSAATSYKLVTDAPIPVGGSLTLPKPINLEVGDGIRIIASTAGALNAVMAIVEITN